MVIERRSPKEVATVLGIPLKTLEKWITLYHRDENVFKESYKTKDEIIKGLLKDNKRLKENMELLKKVLAFSRKTKDLGKNS